ncbi:unnamed protein product [Sphagnum troendelagicum]
MADTLNSNILEIEEDPTVTGQVTSFKSTTQRSRSEVAPPRPLSCYGSEPKKFWSELSSRDVQDKSCDLVETLSEDKSPLEVQLLDPFDIFLLQKIGEGGQAHVFLATCKKFSTPLVVERLNYKLKRGQEDLVELQKRMDKVMKTSRRNTSAVCKVMGVGMDAVGNACIVMERMGGDLRNLIDHGVRCVGDGRMPYVDGQMPFDYTDTIKMMIDISQGMQDLHSCGLIHRDLKAANILVTPLPLDSHLGEVLIESVELEQDLESFYFYVRIGDYESSDDVVGSRFWRPPEVLQSLKDRTEPVKWSFAGDVYSFGMLCYELLTGRIPFEKEDWTDYDVVLSGQRPELPPHVNPKMTELLHSCWQMEPEKRPGWTEIIERLSEELESHPPGLLEKQQQGTGPVKSQALPIIWEEDYDFAKWETTSVWRELLQGHAIPNGEAALKALMPREVARALEDMAAVKVNVASTSREAIAAWFAAMESRLPQTPAASEVWHEIKKNSDFDDTFSFESSLWSTEEVLDAWREESPVEFQAWQEAVDEAREHNTVLETWTAAYSEIENLETRVRDLRTRPALVRNFGIRPAVKVESDWEADMNLMLLEAFDSLLQTAKFEALRKAERAREMFRAAEKSLPTETILTLVKRERTPYGEGGSSPFLTLVKKMTLRMKNLSF